MSLPMAKPLFELDSVTVASPCSMDWEAMQGDQRKRHCSACELDVYDLSSMTREEAIELIGTRRGGRTCVRFFRRADGTVLTEDCPVGLRARIARRAARIVVAVIAAFMSVYSLFVGSRSSSSALSTLTADPEVTEPVPPPTSSFEIVLESTQPEPSPTPSLEETWLGMATLGVISLPEPTEPTPMPMPGSGEDRASRVYVAPPPGPRSQRGARWWARIPFGRVLLLRG